MESKIDITLRRTVKGEPMSYTTLTETDEDLNILLSALNYYAVGTVGSITRSETEKKHRFNRARVMATRLMQTPGYPVFSVSYESEEKDPEEERALNEAGREYLDTDKEEGKLSADGNLIITCNCGAPFGTVPEEHKPLCAIYKDWYNNQS